MSEIHTNPFHREIIERYCHVIDRNTVIVKCDDGTSHCMNSAECIKNGGCKNEKYKPRTEI